MKGKGILLFQGVTHTAEHSQTLKLDKRSAESFLTGCVRLAKLSPTPQPTTPLKGAESNSKKCLTFILNAQIVSGVSGSPRYPNTSQGGAFK